MEISTFSKQSVFEAESHAFRFVEMGFADAEPEIRLSINAKDVLATTERAFRIAKSLRDFGTMFVAY
jgi:hypothetical protein